MSLTPIYTKDGNHQGYIDLNDKSDEVNPADLTEQELQDIHNSEPFYTKDALECQTRY